MRLGFLAALSISFLASSTSAQVRQGKPSSNSETYPGTQAWASAPDGKDGKVLRFTSTLCGLSFAAPATAHLQLPNVSKGICAVILQGKQYPARTGPGSASFVIISQPALPDQSLPAFVQKLIKKPGFPAPAPVSGLPCPASTCFAYEIVTDQLYAADGGAHLLAIAWTSEPPDPANPAKTPEDTFQRLPGPRYTVVAFDANADIYAPSRADFEAFLKTIDPHLK